MFLLQLHKEYWNLGQLYLLAKTVLTALYHPVLFWKYKEVINELGIKLH
jgi:hypothetical protein